MSRGQPVAGVTLGVIVSVLLGALPAGAAAPSPGVPAAVDTPRFVKDKAIGLRHTYDGDLFYVGGGVAAFDCDADGLPELYLAGGSNPAELFHNESAVGGRLRFAPLPDAATDLTSVTGAYPLDIDGDGITDLAVLRIGEDVLLRGLGDCRFERANEAWTFPGGDAWTTAFSATWEGDATLPTLAFGGYLDMSGEGTAEQMCSDDLLVRPTLAGTGYDAAIPLTPSHCALSMLFSDWDRSGRRDLRVTNDRHYYREGSDLLWRMEPGAPPTLYAEADGWADVEINGMGIATYDVTGDGFPEYYLSNQGENLLETLVDGPTRPTYDNMGYPIGLSAQRPFTGGDPLPSTAWHPEFADVNNDGRIDLFISKGNIGGVPDYAQKDPSNLLLGTVDGTFTERARQAGILSYKLGRGAAVVDLNRDGLLDLVQVPRGTPVLAWRNMGAGAAKQATPMGHWAAVELQQPGANRDAIGAWIEVRTGDLVQRRELTVGGGHLSGQLGPIHFGLGDATDAQARVQWADGEWSDWLPLLPDEYQTITRGATETVPMPLPK
ncbi:MAG: CRTAC1 family protein [Chloroflexi bacterium]|nr:CRTAC1 family protein [Chloroflexota bacterium]